MPRPRMHTTEKAKDFKKSIIRFVKELKEHKILIIISLLLSVTSSILAIFTPNILSDLTNEISKLLMSTNNNINII